MSKFLDKLHIAISAVAIAAAGSTSASELGPSNLLVSNLQTGDLYEYTRQGSLVQQFAIPDVESGFHGLRDIVTAADGRVYMFNGTFTPALSVLTPATGEIESFRTAGWSTVNNGTFGGIATWGSSVFVSDMTTFGNEAAGIVRFDMPTGTASRLADSMARDYTDLSVGQDGLLYGFTYSNVIDVFNPVTGSLVRSLALATFADIRGIAVDSAGSIYAADWNGGIHRFNAAGAQQGIGLETGASLTDIDITISGDLVIGSRFGNVYLTDTSLQSFTSFNVNGTFGPTVHVAFALAPVPEPSTRELMLPGLCLATLLLRRKMR